MSAILNALGSGYGAQQILRYLSQHNPNLGQQISAAVNAGHTAEHILNFISRNEKKLGKLIPDKEKTAPSSNLYKTAQTSIHPSLKGMANTAVGVGLAGAGAYALSRAAPHILQQLSGGAGVPPASPQQGLLGYTSNTPQPQQNTPTGPSTPPIQPQTPQPPTNSPSNLQQTPETQQVIPNLNAVLGKYPGFLSKIEDLRRSGNDSVGIAAYFQKFNPAQTKKLEKEAGQPLEKIIEEYLLQETKIGGEPTTNQLPKPTELVGNGQEVLQNQPENGQIPGVQEEKSPKIEKSSIVASPHGMGEVKEIRNGKALIEIDGKKHQVDEDELIQSPLPEKDLADLYDDVLRGIEAETGQEVSRNVNWSGYDPVNNELAYHPHNGGLWVYDNISPEDVAELTNILSQRKTSGSNFIGAWQEGSKSPIGAAMFRLIQKLQKERGGKGNEYKNKFLTIYDAFEPASLALKEKNAKRKKKKT